MKRFQYSELKQYEIVLVRIAIFATGSKNSTDLLAVIQIFQILIKEIVLLLVTFADIFMQNNVFISLRNYFYVVIKHQILNSHPQVATEICIKKIKVPN